MTLFRLKDVYLWKDIYWNDCITISKVMKEDMDENIQFISLEDAKVLLDWAIITSTKERVMEEKKTQKRLSSLSDFSWRIY